MNTKEPLISIIVPVYNASGTLSRCISSVVAQTFREWELILVDDGSTDESLRICKEEAVKDERIRTFSLSHQGVGATRNHALENVRGEYVCFVDADDTVEPDFLNLLYQYHDYDMVICGYFVDNISKEGGTIKKEIHLPQRMDFLPIVNRKELLPLFMSGMIHINCNKLLRSSVIKRHKLRYTSVPINEDYLFMIEYLSYCNSLATIEKPLYHWIRVEGTKTGVDSMPKSMLEIYNLAHQKSRAFFNDDETADVTQYYSYCLIVHRYFRAYREGAMTKNELSKNLSSFHKNPYVKASFQAYSPKSKGERLMHQLLKHGLFYTHQILFKLL